ncbi:hypothetical protein [Ralstonia pseudosolanacearum]|uniref:hypothetical protein n=1 Tax=Ralstonia pseudosolanacearum TaxID=1310165 RepID=UPI001865B4AA|nr:hypothetical protein [Ralstonia pseudosolanacearum]QOK90742.1 hypothetical protein HF908_04130 [Ralstonia pseudosolanacearum]UWD91699.1 hypothetical protein NY025_11925 [Ralstonia pseudosolanacearum]CAH0439835.1 hypothetical protein LMG9673_00618 [Ralstonia pseudosolanacearum]
MPADKLGRFITSDLFLARANAAIAKAVHQLEEQGITPSYIERPQSDESKTHPDYGVTQAPKGE